MNGFLAYQSRLLCAGTPPRFLDYVSVHCFDRLGHTFVNVNMCGNMVPVVSCWLQEDFYTQEGLRASGKDS